MNQPELGLASTICRSPEHVAATIDEITAVMDAEAEVYYLIDAIGSVIWSRIAEPVRIADLCGELVDEYDVEQGDCERDVLAFCRDMIACKLALASS